MTIILTFVSSAYVAVKTVDAGVSSTIGFYSNHAGSSELADYLLAFELVVILTWLLFALVENIVVLVYGSELWNKLDARLADAAEASLGLENALTWGKAIKISTLCFIVSLGNLITGYALGDVADNIIEWFANYENDKETQEGTQKTNSNNVDPDGTGF